MSGLRFPTMLRKMWSGGEVQAWLDKQTAISRHDYFMAHAPARPQHWFQPAMSGPCPAVPSINSIDPELRAGVLDYWESDCAEGIKPRVLEWVAVRDAAEKAQAEWQAEFRKQLLVQWPRVWADEMLKAAGS